jgi:D-alanyl-D-alanine carboxypeptidase
LASRPVPRHAPTSLAARPAPRFDPALARQLQRALRDALRDPSATAPGAILHVRGRKLGAWTGVAGLGRVSPDVPTRSRDRFRAGSIAKPFVSVVVLQLAERGRLSLDARLPQVLPADVLRRFPTAADITVRMLLGHRSGLPEWDSPAVDEQVARDPAKVWSVSEFLDPAAAQPPLFAPGTGFFYSNTNYNLLGLIIERITGRSWRREVTRRIIRPLRLTGTDLPGPRAPVDHGSAHARLRPVGGQDDRPHTRRPVVRRRRRRLRVGHHCPGLGPVHRCSVQRAAVPPPVDAAFDAAHGAGAG